MGCDLRIRPNVTAVFCNLLSVKSKGPRWDESWKSQGRHGDMATLPMTFCEIGFHGNVVLGEV